ncbi:hypothetical protein P7C73_g1506, partial [Tremellales sp. Uapishka_1]
MDSTNSFISSRSKGKHRAVIDVSMDSDESLKGTNKTRRDQTWTLDPFTGIPRESGNVIKAASSSSSTRPPLPFPVTPSRASSASSSIEEIPYIKQSPASRARHPVSRTKVSSSSLATSESRARPIQPRPTPAPCRNLSSSSRTLQSSRSAFASGSASNPIEICSSPEAHYIMRGSLVTGTNKRLAGRDFSAAPSLTKKIKSSAFGSHSKKDSTPLPDRFSIGRSLTRTVSREDTVLPSPSALFAELRDLGDIEAAGVRRDLKKRLCDEASVCSRGKHCSDSSASTSKSVPSSTLANSDQTTRPRSSRPSLSTSPVKPRPSSLKPNSSSAQPATSSTKFIPPISKPALSLKRTPSSTSMLSSSHLRQPKTVSLPRHSPRVPSVSTSAPQLGAQGSSSSLSAIPAASFYPSTTPSTSPTKVSSSTLSKSSFGSHAEPRRLPEPPAGKKAHRPDFKASIKKPARLRPVKALAERPTRVKAEPGKYTLPPVDTPIHEWPTSRGTVGGPSRSRKMGKRAMEKQNQGSTGTREESVALAAKRSGNLAKSPTTPAQPVMLRSRTFSSELSSAPSTPEKKTQKLENADPTPRPVHARIILEEEIVDNETHGEEEEFDNFDDFEFTVKTPQKLQFDHNLPRSPVSSPTKQSHLIRASPQSQTKSPTKLCTESSDTTTISSHQTNDVIDGILAKAQIAEAKQQEARRKAQHEIEERRKVMTELLMDNEAEDPELEDVGALLTSEVAKAAQPEAAEPAIRSPRRTNRMVAASSLTLTPALTPKKAVKSADSKAFERIMRQQEKDRREGRSGRDVERTLQALRKSQSPTKESTLSTRSGPYPTPDSGGTKSRESSFDSNDGQMDLDRVKDQLPGDLKLDTRLLEDVKRGKNAESDPLAGWPGFWRPDDGLSVSQLPSLIPRVVPSLRQIDYDRSIPPLRIQSENRIVSTIVQAAIARDEDRLANLLGYGIFDLVPSGKDRTILHQWLLDCALTSQHPTFPSTAARYLIVEAMKTSEVSKAFSDPFMCPNGFAGRILSIWYSVGAHAAGLPSLAVSENITLRDADRQFVSGFLCELIAIAARSDWLSSKDSCLLVPTLLLLSLDPTTEPSILQSIDESLEFLWPLCLANQSALEYTQLLLEFFRDLPVGVQTALQFAIGQRSKEARQVGRWMALGVVQPGCLEGIIQDETRAVPGVSLICRAADDIYAALVAERPDFSEILDKVSLLYEAVTDVEALVEIQMSTGNDSEQVSILKAAITRAHNCIKDRGTGDVNEGIIKSRLGQLETSVGLQVKTALTRRARSHVVGKHMVIGQDGQAKLTFHGAPRGV